VWAGVDSAWEQEKLEARKMLENAAESHTSGARFVGTLLDWKRTLFFSEQTTTILTLKLAPMFFHKLSNSRCSLHLSLDTLIR